MQTDVVNIDRTVFPDNERFPEEIQVHFNHYGNAITLNLWRDDETTDLLSESVFMMSKFLPSDVFDDDNREVNALLLSHTYAIKVALSSQSRLRVKLTFEGK